MKGISAVISTVLVLLVTISAVSLFSSWAPDLVQDLTTTTSNQTQNRVDCNRADLEVVSADYKSSDGNTTTVIRNTGTMDLDPIRIEAWKDNLPLNETTTSLNAGNLTTENVTTNKEPTSVITISKQCSNAQDEFEDIK